MQGASEEPQSHVYAARKKTFNCPPFAGPVEGKMLLIVAYASQSKWLEVAVMH